ncbi:glycosyltransferase family 4 protein [Paenibacillus sp. JSM ZJ436]|uniref:glycosyltransferase family 4 protein n=1 Tax=Paenibacillus sp. JSM ZJ436 TaxID=3376190 RepID=UPI00379CC9FE
MKVLIDPEIFFYGRCGMVRYYSALFQELERRGVEMDLPLLRSQSDFISGRLQWLDRAKPLLDRLPYGGKLYTFVNKMSKAWYRQKVKQGHYDALFMTSPVFEDSFLNDLPGGKPSFMVVHDTMRCVLGPDGLYDPAGSNADRLASLIHRASKVFAISHQTAQDIVSLTGTEQPHMTVIHTGNLLSLQAERAVEGLPSRYLLFVGDRTGRKNFRFLLQSLSRWLREEETGLQLVCTGPSNPWEQDLLGRLGLQERVTFVEAPDEVLVYLYRHAEGLLFPSLYEGFGLPVLEAMSLGCPVVTSGQGALLEVGGEAPIYVDPCDAASILEGVKLLMQDEHRQQRIKAGLEQSRRFTLSRMADHFQQEMEEVLRGGGRGERSRQEEQT